MSYEDEFNRKSIWGKEGNPAIKARAHNDAVNSKGEDLMDTGRHTETYKAGYEEGKREFKKQEMEEALLGKGEYSKKELDKIFDRHDKVSKGGIILP